MSSAVFTVIGVYGAWQRKGSGWIVWSSFGAAVALFFVASFKAWNEEHKARADAEGALNDISPKLYLEYSADHAKQFMAYSGLFVRNAGKKAAFKAYLGCSLATIRLEFREMPIERIDPDNGKPVDLLTEYLNDNKLWYPIGGLPGAQIQSCFERLNEAGLDETIPVTIKYADYEGREYKTPCVIRCDNTLFLIKRIWCELV